MKYQPRITIIIAVYNSASTIERCLESIITQNYSNKELIVIDGNSTDGTLNILENYSDYIDYIESKKDRGIYHAWNKALTHATGEWICFLGADDFFLNENTFEKLVPHFYNAEKAKIKYVYGQIKVVQRNGKFINIEGKPWYIAKKRYNQICTITHSGSFHHRDFFHLHGKFDEYFKISGDYEFILRELKNKNAYFAKDIFIAGVSIGGISRNLDNRFTFVHEALIARSRHANSFPWAIYFIFIQVCILKILQILFGNYNTYRFIDYVRTLFGKQKIWEKNFYEN